jgi:hypothetical protein
MPYTGQRSSDLLLNFPLIGLPLRLLTLSLTLALLLAPNAHPQALIDAPSKGRVIDRKFVAFSAYQATASVLDVESTIGMMKANPYCTEEWSAWFTGQRPGRGRLYFGAALGNLATGTLAYYLRRKGKSYWWVPQVSIGSLQVYTATHNRFISGCYR